MKFTIHTLVAASALALLSACGGDDSTDHPAGNLLAITSANQNDVARASINGGLAIALGESALGGNSGPDAVTGRSHALGATLSRVMRAAMNRRKGVSSLGAQPSAVSSSTEACASGGTFTTSFDDKDGNGQVSSGDAISATFSQCHETATSTVDGAVSIQVTITPTDTLYTANVQYQMLSVVDAGAATTVDGKVSVSETDTSAHSDTTITVGSDGLTVTLASSTYNDRITIDSGMVVTTSVENSSGAVSLTTAGSFTSQALGGRLTVATPVPMVEAAANEFPSSGVIWITGASGSTLMLTGLNASQAQLQLDTNGDGTYESTTTVAWTTLVP
jgi:hypothetical protein